MWNRLTEPARQSVLQAHHLAAARRDASVQPAHLFIALMDVESSRVDSILSLNGVSRVEARLYAESVLEASGTRSTEKPKLNGAAKRVLQRAEQEAQLAKRDYIGPEHLFISCVRPVRGSQLSEVLCPFGFEVGQIRYLFESVNSPAKSRREGSPLNHLSTDSSQAIEAAHEIMRTTFCGRISTVHLLLGLLSVDSGPAIALLHDTGLDPEVVRQLARAEVVSDGQIATAQKKFSTAAKRALERAKRESREADDAYIGPDHILLGLLARPLQLRLDSSPTSGDSVERVFTQAQADAMRRTYDGKLEAQWDQRLLGTDNADDPIAHLTTQSRELLFDPRYSPSMGAARERVHTIQIFFRLFDNKTSAAYAVLRAANIDLVALEVAARQLLESPDSYLASRCTWRALKRAHREARAAGYRFIGPEHILLGLLPQESTPEEGAEFGDLADPLESLWTPEMVAAIRATVALRSVQQDRPLPPRAPQASLEPSFLEHFSLFLKSFLFGALATVAIENLLFLFHLSSWGPSPMQLLLGPLLSLALGVWFNKNYQIFSWTMESRNRAFGALLLGVVTALFFWG